MRYHFRRLVQVVNYQHGSKVNNQEKYNAGNNVDAQAVAQQAPALRIVFTARFLRNQRRKPISYTNAYYQHHHKNTVYQRYRSQLYRTCKVAYNNGIGCMHQGLPQLRYHHRQRQFEAVAVIRFIKSKNAFHKKDWLKAELNESAFALQRKEITK